MLRRLIIFIVVVVAVLGIAVAGYWFLNSPEVVAYRALRGAAIDFTEREEIKPLLNTFKKGSAEFNLNKITMGNEVPFDGQASGKLYFSSNAFTGNAFMLSDFTFKYDSIDINGDLYISDEEIYVEESQVLQGAYGAKFDELADDLSKSIFAPSSNSQYALDQETYDIIIKALESLEDNDVFSKDSKKISKKVGKDIGKIIMSYAETDSEIKEVTIDGKTMEVRIITFSFDAAAKQSIIRDVYKYLCESEDIAEFIDENEDTLAPMLETMYGIKCEGSLRSEYTKWLTDAEDDVEKLCDKLKYSNTSDVMLTTNKKGVKLLKLELASKDTSISLDFGSEGVKEADEIKLVTSDFSITYAIQDNDSSQRKMTLTLQLGHVTLLKSVLSINYSDERYTLVLSGMVTDTVDFRIAIPGSISKKGKTTTFTVDSLEILYLEGTRIQDTTFNLDLSVTLNTIDKMPKPIMQYQSITVITDQDVHNWKAKLFYSHLLK